MHIHLHEQLINIVRALKLKRTRDYNMTRVSQLHAFMQRTISVLYCTICIETSDESIDIY